MGVSKTTRRYVFAAGLLASVAFTMTTSPTASASDGAHGLNWKPKVTEKLVKLPNTYLKKALDNDFRKSSLAGAIQDVETEIKFKRQSLADLKAAAEQSEGGLRVELDHQFLAEKKAYLDLVQESHQLKRKHLKTKQRLYERLLKRMARENAGKTPRQAELVQKQLAAQSRFERTQETVDVALFEDSVAQNSRYAKEYSQNLQAIKSLVAAIDAHPMTQKAAEMEATQESKPAFVRGLLAQADGELALLDQSQEVVGLMAKLVALDAQALVDEVEEDLIADAPEEPEEGLTAAINLFIQ